MLIESGVPIPQRYGAGRSRKFPLDQLEIGESFAVPEDEANALRSACTHFKNSNPGVEFVTRKQEDGGVRVWRVDPDI